MLNNHVTCLNDFMNFHWLTILKTFLRISKRAYNTPFLVFSVPQTNYSLTIESYFIENLFFFLIGALGIGLSCPSTMFLLGIRTSSFKHQDVNRSGPRLKLSLPIMMQSNRTQRY